MSPEELDMRLACAVSLAAKLREESWMRPHTLQNPTAQGYYALTLDAAAEEACRDKGFGPFTAKLVASAIVYDWNYILEDAELVQN